ncbi:MAG: hypothetical protein HUU27_08405 [Phycisphaerae bacterium]|nr:hypothetical protein [Phycisphaerae bacterium]
MLATTWNVMDRARDLVERRLESGELEQIVERALANAGSSSGAAPESSASTPAG